MAFETKYLKFELSTEQNPKTLIWEVISQHHGNVLGEIRWYGSWQQYCFYPEGETVWNTECLQDVQAFIMRQMNLRKMEEDREKIREAKIDALKEAH